MKIGSSYSYAIIVLSSIVGITSTAAASDNVPRPIPLEREEDTAANSNGVEDARYLRGIFEGDNGVSFISLYFIYL